MTDILSLSFEELNSALIEAGEKAFRTGQVFSWLHEKKARDFDEMTNLSKDLREKLRREFRITRLRIEAMQESMIDGTRKYLFGLSDGNLIESVFMRYEFGNSVCVSSQVGCRMGCRFCASTVDGLVRNLTAGEILSQIYEIERHTGEAVSHIVIMGSGEPFDNYDNVIAFIRLVTDPRGRNLSRRNITLSTCGLPDGIRKLAEEELPVTLALSLHAPNDEVRKKLMPVAKRYKLSEVLDACAYYFEKTGRRVTYEYSVVRGVNDSVREAVALGHLLSGKQAHVNLIPVNPIKERSFEKPQLSGLRDFQKVLAKYGINATIRREMGSDIDGACGQLRRRVSEKKERRETMRISGKTDLGKTRKNNEDAFYISSKPVGMFDSLMIIADGMGGHLCGEVASRTALDTFVEHVKESSFGDRPETVLRSAASAANLAVLNKAGELDAPGMGTTMVGAGVIGNRVYALNIGDSRLYLINDNDASVTQITRDHSYVEEQVEAGLMERGSAEYDAQKNMITRAVGSSHEVDSDLFDFTIRSNMYLLLCSDGLTNMVTDDTIKEIVLDASASLDKKVKHLIKKANENGGRDNITVVLAAAEVNHD